jgi:hypothetical protein
MYSFVCEWEDRERERIPFPIALQNCNLLKNVGLHNFYDENTYLRRNSLLL